MIKLLRTNSDNPDFRELIKSLDEILRENDGEEHSFFAKYNTLDNIKHAVVAYSDKVPVGCGALKKYTEDTAEIKRMFICEESRRQGIAKIILKDLEQWSKELNFSNCILETGKKLTEAVNFYKSCGYKVIPNYGQYSEKEASICLQKSI
ncbi:MAG: GNAT family N-acetyltransferase [Ignavibacteria bacterium]